MLEIRSLSAGYGTLTALDGISARLSAGARLGIFGHNGAGKTTLLRCIVGAHAARAGEVVFDGEPVRPGNVPATIRRGIAFVPQGHNVFPNLTVAQNLATAGLLFDRGFVGEVLKIFPLLEERRSQRAGSLSGGEQQMLALGMALMTQPKWLLLDEPSTGLAPVIVRNVMSQLAKVNAAFGTGLIIVEQNVPATLKVVEHCLILKSGRTVFEGTAETLSAKPDLWEWF
ncbi:ABC transporter ATP-binding protein [Methylobacterium nodulans]|uniref:ABC transporter related n=1 Tax=Methylobacterium nodulans (strain LMG 21967 / CNCM I-2342 / ORS 2060) TaxID=460265 RepID=B8IWR1_METNO|nr:ABC transporter ATP-binding protein [Methylobacterium nodulans]ACL62952.1 ABC transporter related [Methylobacterium nodulans ORS 2060]